MYYDCYKLTLFFADWRFILSKPIPVRTYFIEDKRLSITVGRKLRNSSRVKPSLCIIFICLTSVLFPLSPAPKLKKKIIMVGKTN